MADATTLPDGSVATTGAETGRGGHGLVTFSTGQVGPAVTTPNTPPFNGAGAGTVVVLVDRGGAVAVVPGSLVEVGRVIPPAPDTATVVGVDGAVVDTVEVLVVPAVPGAVEAAVAVASSAKPDTRLACGGVPQAPNNTATATAVQATGTDQVRDRAHDRAHDRIRGTPITSS